MVDGSGKRAINALWQQVVWQCCAPQNEGRGSEEKVRLP